MIVIGSTFFVGGMVLTTVAVTCSEWIMLLASVPVTTIGIALALAGGGKIRGYFEQAD